MTNSFVPVKLNFSIWQPSTFRYAFQWVDEEGEGESRKRVPHNLTGYGGKGILSCDNGETFELTTKPEGGWPENKGRIYFKPITEAEEEPTTGFIMMYIDSSFTSGFTWKKASYELLLKEGAIPNEASEPDVYAVLSGVFTISRRGSVQ